MFYAPSNNGRTQELVRGNDGGYRGPSLFLSRGMFEKKKIFLLSVRVQSPASIIPRRLFRLCFVCCERGCQPLYLFSRKVSFVDGLFGFLAYADQR